MRPLEPDAHGDPGLTNDHSDDVPPYAILSHTWGVGHL
jgi:hypothetical protein